MSSFRVFFAVLVVAAFALGFIAGGITVGDTPDPSDSEQATVQCSLSAENDTPMAVCFKTGDVNVSMDLNGSSESGNVTLRDLPSQEQEVDSE